MPRQIFRKTAIERLSSPEQLDTLLYVVSGKGWLALIALGGLIVGTLLWGIYGTIPEKVYGQGILIQTSGIFNVVSQSSGPVTEVKVKVGDLVTTGQVIAEITQPAAQDNIEETQSQLTSLEKQHNSLIKYGEKDIQLQKELLAKQREDLGQTNKNLEKQLDWLKEKAKGQDQVLQKGLITRQTLRDTMDSIDSIEQQVSENSRQIEQTFVQLLDLENQHEQELLTSQQSIDSAKAQLASFQHQLELDSQVVSPYAGRVLEVMSERGRTLSIGDPILQLELTETDDTLDVVFFINAGEGENVRSGMTAEVSPVNVKQEEYGYMLGSVSVVSQYPATEQGMYRILQSETLVQTMSAGGVVIEVNADLIPDAQTFSGYRWSSSKGPYVKVQSGLLCTVGVTYKEYPPISMVIPLIKKYVLGIGDEFRQPGQGI